MFKGGAKAKTQIQDQQPRVKQRSHLPVHLQNDFYADVIVIHSEKDNELAQRFLSDIEKHFKKDDDYIIVSYLDERLRTITADGCKVVDYKRCSVVFFIFTEKSVKEYDSLMKDKDLEQLLYNGKFVPVLTKPKEELDLPMCARVPVSLIYCTQMTFECPHAVLVLLQNNSHIRRRKEKRHKEKESEYSTDHPLDPDTGASQNIYINAHNLIMGNDGKIVDYIESENENVTRFTRTHSMKPNGSQLTGDIWNDADLTSKESASFSPSYQDEIGKTHQNFSLSMQTPFASMNYSGDEQNWPKTKNQSRSQNGSITSTATEDYASMGGGHERPVRNASSGLLQNLENSTPPDSVLSSNMPRPVQIFPNGEGKFESFGSLTTSAARGIANEEASGESRHTDPEHISYEKNFISEYHSPVSANPKIYSSETPNVPWQNKGGTKPTTLSNDQSLPMNLSNVDRMIKTETPWSSHQYDKRKAREEVTPNPEDSLVLRGEGLDFRSLLENNE